MELQRIARDLLVNAPNIENQVHLHLQGVVVTAIQSDLHVQNVLTCEPNTRTPLTTMLVYLRSSQYERHDRQITKENYSSKQQQAENDHGAQQKQ